MKPKHINEKETIRTHKSVSVEEIMAAGGPTAFGIKSGKNNETMKKALRDSPKPEPFTDEEWADLLIQFANDK